MPDHPSLAALARRVLAHETGGDPAKLLHWNRGERFASLGLGHFLWYPEGVDAPFAESFPALLRHLERSGVALPAWLSPDTPCPWPTRRAFEASRGSARNRELRALLEATLPQQAAFLVTRLEATLEEILRGAPGPAAREALERRIEALRSTPEGLLALVDYRNFKGSGLDPRERRAGRGWGLKQVLETMDAPSEACPVRAFRDAAATLLTRRVDLDPTGRERRWIRGWLRRLDGYLRPLGDGPAPCRPPRTSP